MQRLGLKGLLDRPQEEVSDVDVIRRSNAKRIVIWALQEGHLFGEIVHLLAIAGMSDGRRARLQQVTQILCFYPTSMRRPSEKAVDR